MASKTAAKARPNAKAKPAAKKPTARDLGVPDAYVSANGKFRPGMDARYKSDLILRALDQPAPNALVKFTQAEAIKLLAKFPQWKPFLDRKKERRRPAATSAKPAKKS